MMQASWPRQLTLFVLAGLLAVSAAWSAGKVTGNFVGNGKEAKLVYAVVIPHEPWNDTPVYTIILAEKDPAATKDSDCLSALGKLGSALVVNVSRKGEVLSTQVCHQALKRRGFFSPESLSVDSFKIEGKQLSGHFFTQKMEEFFDEHWSADVTVQAALP